MADEQTAPNCSHNSTEDGPVIPRVYGSGRTIVCRLCGAWLPLWNEAAGWRPAETLAQRMERDDER